MQFLVISHQLFEILLGILIGLALGATYDLLRFVRRFCIRVIFETLFANFFDILFSVVAGTVYCVFVYSVSNGKFRWFTAFAVFFGYVVYTVGPSRVIRSILFWIADRLCGLVRIIAIPFKMCLFAFGRRVSYVRRTISYNRQKSVTESLKLQLYECVMLLDDGDIL